MNQAKAFYTQLYAVGRLDFSKHGRGVITWICCNQYFWYQRETPLTNIFKGDDKHTDLDKEIKKNISSHGSDMRALLNNAENLWLKFHMLKFCISPGSVLLSSFVMVFMTRRVFSRLTNSTTVPSCLLKNISWHSMKYTYIIWGDKGH